jgi:hypothetical protein
MASNLACVGLAVADDDELQRLVARAVRRSRLLGRRRGVAVRRWEDPSGARLVFGMRFGSVLELLPSFAAPRAVVLGEIADVNDEVCSADVLDAQGQALSAVAFELEERRFLDAHRRAGGAAAIVALGQDIAVHDEGAQHPPAESQVDHLARESFSPIGALAGRAEAEATAILSGVVLQSDRRTNALTRQSFVVAKVRTAGFAVQLCLSGTEHPDPLRPGQIVIGKVFVTASLSEPRTARAKRPWRRGDTTSAVATGQAGPG